jgi:hypothetical protein
MWDDFVRPRPERPYGVVLGSLVVLDGDTPPTAIWIREQPPTTPFRVQTGPYHDGQPGRGVHFYFRAPQGTLPAFIRRNGLAIGCKRAGYYVVGPGSVHPCGCIYKVHSLTMTSTYLRTRSDSLDGAYDQLQRHRKGLKLVVNH